HCQLLRLFVPDRERKHPVKLVDGVRPELFVEVHDRFCIASRLITVPLAFERPAQRGMVVDLAVEGDPHGAIFIAHRLLARARHVDNRQAAMREPDRAGNMQASPVGAAMAHHVAHADQAIGLSALARIELENSSNGTHQRSVIRKSRSSIRTDWRRSSRTRPMGRPLSSASGITTGDAGCGSRSGISTVMARHGSAADAEKIAIGAGWRWP